MLLNFDFRFNISELSAFSFIPLKLVSDFKINLEIEIA